MKAIVHDMPESWLEERRRRGQDRFDEMWDGILHVNPGPGLPHQDFKEELLQVLKGLQALAGLPGQWCGERNLAMRGGWPDDFRIPDLVYLAGRGRFTRLESHIEGPPTIVVEIAGEGDESRAKLAWYAELGVPEIWIVDLSTRVPEILLLSGTEYLKQRPGPGNWFRSEGFPVELRAGRAGKRKVLEVRAPGESKARAKI